MLSLTPVLPAPPRFSASQVKIADFGACVILNQDDEDADGDISSSGSSVGSHKDGGRDRDRRKVIFGRIRTRLLFGIANTVRICTSALTSKRQTRDGATAPRGKP